jgi:hypothetical protein
MENKIKFIANAVRWCDKVNGNTYHSVNITRVKDGKTIYCPFQYGYGDQYRHTAMLEMLKQGWIDNSKYTDILSKPDGNKKHYQYWERENNYPIYWNVTDGLKRDCIKNGKE